MNEVFKILIAFIVGLGIGAVAIGADLDGRLNSADRELAEYRDRIVEFTDDNLRLETTNDQLRDRIAGLTDTIDSAAGIARGIGQTVDSLSSQSGSATEKLRRVIVALTEIRDRLRVLENLGDNLGSQ